MSDHLKLLLAFLLFSSGLFGQLDDISLEELNAPSIPAGVIIGSQLNEVSGIRSMVALETVILDNFTDDSSRPGIFSDVAIDVQPYMLGPRKNFSYTDHLEKSPSFGDRLWRNLSISLASTKSFQVLDTTNSDALGFGLSLVLLNGQPSDTVKSAFSEALQLYDRRSGISGRAILALELFEVGTDAPDVEGLIEIIIEEVLADATPVRNEDATEIRAILQQLDWSTEAADRQDRFEALYDELYGQLALDELRSSLYNVKNIRTGLRIGVDLASGVTFPTDDFDLAYGSRSGAWINASYRPPSEENVNGASSSEFLFLSRIIWHNQDFYDRFVAQDGQRIPELNMDFGLKYALHREKWSIGIEAISRFQTLRELSLMDGATTSETINEQGLKYLLDLNYAVFDQVTLSYNVGKDFDEEFTSNGNLISLIGISVDLGELSIGDLFRNTLDTPDDGN